MLYQLISTFSGEPPVNEQVARPVIVIKTLIIKLKPIQEKTYSQVHKSSLEEVNSTEFLLKDILFLRES